MIIAAFIYCKKDGIMLSEKVIRRMMKNEK